MKETFRALKKLYEESRIKAVGVSNFTISHIKQALQVSDVPITINQVEFHPFLYQKELLDFCNEKDIRITAYSPLARGGVFKDREIQEIAKRYNKSPGQISMRWLIQKGLIVIPKASSEPHLKENMQIFDFEIKEKDIDKLDNLPKQRIVDPGFSEFNQ